MTSPQVLPLGDRGAFAALLAAVGEQDANGGVEVAIHRHRAAQGARRLQRRFAAIKLMAADALPVQTPVAC